MRLAVLLIAACMSACTMDETLARLATDAAPDVDGGSLEASSNDCPADAGPTMAKIPAAAGAYCIDLTEVTKAQYAAWLATAPSTSGQADACDWNLDFAPASTSDDGTCSAAVNDPVAHPQLPVVCVDWCDALAFCAAAGKRLCGKIGGGAEGYLDDPGAVLRDPNESEWLHACTNGGTTAYPYGAAFDATACDDDPSDAGAPAPVGSFSACHGAGGTVFGAVYDLSGDVAEWTDDCVAQTTGESGKDNSCFVRGGWWGDFRPGALACDPVAANPGAPPTVIEPRSHLDHHIGFRCCAF